MKKKKVNQPTEIVRKSNQELLEAMKQAMIDHGPDQEINKILFKVMTFKPDNDAVHNAVVELLSYCNREHYNKKYGIDNV